MAPFFFSYAHNDALDEHLEEFFDEVNKRVRFFTGGKTDGFKDTVELRAGEEWSKGLADELSASPCMVCLYSPSYFQSRVCSQELQVFLERRQRYMQANPGRRPANIIPVLWQPTEIPRSLPGFQYERPRLPSLANDGVWEVRVQRKMTEFNNIAKSVAIRVKEAQKTPLPPPDVKPVLGGVPSAFEPPPLPPAEFDQDTQTAGPQCATFVYPKTVTWQQWPFTPQDEPLLKISGAVAKGRDLHLLQLSFDPSDQNFRTRLLAARQRNNLVVFLVNGADLNNPALLPRFRECDNEGIESLSTLIVWPGGNKGPQASQLAATAFPRMSAKQPPYFFQNLEGPDQFADAVAQSLDALTMAVLRNPQGVQGLSATSEFSSLPSVAGPGGARQNP